jgi:hypothetical protein
LDWQPLSVREGRRADDGPFDEGAPAHLVPSLVNWLSNVLRAIDYQNDTAAEMIALRLRLPATKSDYIASLVEAGQHDENVLLDAIDMALLLTSGRDAELVPRLQAGGSVWTVAGNGKSLRRRVEPAAHDAYERAVAPQDVAGNELQEAWARALGRHPDASDAWDHAIMAVEAVLIPGAWRRAAPRCCRRHGPVLRDGTPLVGGDPRLS